MPQFDMVTDVEELLKMEITIRHSDMTGFNDRSQNVGDTFQSIISYFIE